MAVELAANVVSDSSQTPPVRGPEWNAGKINSKLSPRSRRYISADLVYFRLLGSDGKHLLWDSTGNNDRYQRGW